MTQEQKQILLVDFCARLPYGVKIRIEYPFLKEEEWHSEILDGLDLQGLCIANTSIRLEEVKPYLFPLSSMTEEQEDELIKFMVKDWYDMRYHTPDSIDWLNANHFDFRNLISRNLAIDYTNLDIY